MSSYSPAVINDNQPVHLILADIVTMSRYDVEVTLLNEDRMVIRWVTDDIRYELDACVTDFRISS
jgi:hypothetical protein